MPPVRLASVKFPQGLALCCAKRPSPSVFGHLCADFVVGLVSSRARTSHSTGVMSRNTASHLILFDTILPTRSELKRNQPSGIEG